MELFNRILRIAIEGGASDVHIKVGSPITFRIDGNLVDVEAPKPTAEWMENILEQIIPVHLKDVLQNQREIDFSYYSEKVGRFRTNCFQQRGSFALAMRYVKTDIPSFEDLGLIPVLKEIAEAPRGIVLVSGTTGCGKSTTLAAMIQHINESSRNHIVTLEDPIEFVHQHNKSIISQREVGVDTMSYRSALENAMRQAPDVIQIGEVRTPETMKSALVFAETGHLCLATLHANNTYQALQRIINLYPDDARDHLYMDLSMNLRAIISQRLIPNAQGNGSVPAVEIMLNSPLISDLILRGEIAEIREVMENSSDEGMMTFDQSLFRLHEEGLISYEDAMRSAESVNNLRLKIKLEGEASKGKKNLGSTFEQVEF